MQVRLTDVGAIEDALNTLQHGSLEYEGSAVGPSSKNCIQVFRLLQLVRLFTWVYDPVQVATQSAWQGNQRIVA